MFLQKLLSGRNNLNKSKHELLMDAWTSVQRYYETASDPLKDAIELTPIPTCLQNIVKLIQSEEFDYQRANDNLATGPCLEYVLQTRVLEELVEFAKVDVNIFQRDPELCMNNHMQLANTFCYILFHRLRTA
jgi:hypothetical protein